MINSGLGCKTCLGGKKHPRDSSSHKEEKSHLERQAGQDTEFSMRVITRNSGIQSPWPWWARKRKNPRTRRKSEEGTDLALALPLEYLSLLLFWNSTSPSTSAYIPSPLGRLLLAVWLTLSPYHALHATHHSCPCCILCCLGVCGASHAMDDNCIRSNTASLKNVVPLCCSWMQSYSVDSVEFFKSVGEPGNRGTAFPTRDGQVGESLAQSSYRRILRVLYTFQILAK